LGLARTYKNSFANLSGQIWLLALSMFINRSGSMVLLFTSLYLTKELGMSISQAGFIMSAYGIGGIMGSFAGGWFSDKKSVFKVMFWALFFAGLFLFCLPFTRNPVLIALLIFLNAFFADLYRPANSKSIALFSQKSNRTRSVSLVRLAANLGFSIGPAVGGFIAFYLGYTWLFVLDGATSWVAAALVWFGFPKEAPKPQHHENDALDKPSVSAYRDKYFLLFVALTAVYGTCFFQLFASIPQFFSKVSQYSETEIGWLLGLNGFIVVVCEMPIVAWLEKSGKPFRSIIAGVICIPLAFFTLWSSQPYVLGAAVYTLLITLSEILAMPFLMNLALNRGQGSRQGEYSALFSIAYGIAVLVAPSLGLGLADWLGFDWMLGIISGMSLALALGFYAFGKSGVMK
jgi:predicted MFS family arabinose efflux permease